MDMYSTKRLILEKVKESDAKELLPIWQNYSVTKYTMVKDIRCLEDCIGRINRQLSWKNGIGPFVIKENETIIGYCGGNANENNEIEMFYHITDDKWGLGLGTEVAKALIDIAFSEKNANKVIAEAVIENVASWKILEKIGMKRIGTEEAVFENREGKHDFYVYMIEKRNIEDFS